LNRSPSLAVLLLALLAALAPHARAADPNDPRFDYCVLCHGTEGRGNEPVSAPRIGGMEDWYLERQLLAFREGWRGVHPDDYQGGEMRPMALALEDEGEVEDAAEHFAAFPVVETPDTVRGDVARGALLYASCAACHGDDAEGRPAMQAPALAHQSDWYLVTQIEHYRRGIRGADPEDELGQQMRALAQTLPDEQAARDLAAYINSIE
jgi:cytochrome c oxidase subunit 2